MDEHSYDKKRAFIKSLLKWIALLLVIHILFSVILYNFTFNKIVSDILRAGGEMQATVFVLIYGGVIFLITLSYYAYTSTSSVTYSDALKAAMKQPDFSCIRHFIRTAGTLNLIRLGIFFILQLPFTIFYAAIDFPIDVSFPIVSFYRLEIGMYALGGAWWLGLLVCILTVGLILFLTQFAALALRARSIRLHAPDGFYSK